MLSVCFVFAVLAFTVYGQLMIKTRALTHSAEAISSPGMLRYLLAMFTDAWVLSGFGASALAGACWMVWIERLVVAYAYPFMALRFVFVPWCGLALIIAGARARLPVDVKLAQIAARAIPDVVEHLADDRAVRGSLPAATTRGGGIIVAVPQHPSLWSRANEIGHHQRCYRLGKIKAKLSRNGFGILFSSSFHEHTADLDGLEPVEGESRPR